MQPLTGLGATLLNSLRVIPNHVAVRLRNAEAELRNAKRYGTQDDQNRAEAQYRKALRIAETYPCPTIDDPKQIAPAPSNAVAK
jgi:hypothetical protein